MPVKNQNSMHTSRTS